MVFMLNGCSINDAFCFSFDIILVSKYVKVLSGFFLVLDVRFAVLCI